MNYDSIYDSLIERSCNRCLKGYAEIHHAVPRCVGGSDNPANLVKLTPEEHYLAHQLLIKMVRFREHPNYLGLVFAANMMSVGRKSNKKYGWLKRRFSEASSLKNKGRKQTPAVVQNRVEKNTGQKRSEDTKRKIAESKRGKSRSPFSDEWKRKLGRSGSENGMFGKTHSEKARKKVSLANTGRTLSEERRLQISEQQKGLKDSDDTKKKKSEAMKKVWEERKRRER